MNQTKKLKLTIFVLAFMVTVQVSEPSHAAASGFRKLFQKVFGGSQADELADGLEALAAKTGRRVEKGAKVPLQPLKKEHEETFAEYGANLTQAAKRGRISDIEGRDADLSIAVDGLSSGRCAFIQGEAGIGRKDLVNGLAYRIAKDDETLPIELRGVNVIEISMDKLKIGTSDKKGSEAILNGRLEKIEKAISENSSQIFVLDGFYEILEAAKPGNDQTARAIKERILKVKKENPDVRLIIKGTEIHQRKMAEMASDLMRHFDVVRMKQPAPLETVNILYTELSQLFRSRGLNADAGTFLAIAKMAEKHIPASNPEATMILAKRIATKVTREQKMEPLALSQLREKKNLIEKEIESLTHKKGVVHDKRVKVLERKLSKVDSKILDLEKAWKSFRPKLDELNSLKDNMYSFIEFFSEIKKRIDKGQPINSDVFQTGLENLAQTFLREPFARSNSPYLAEAIAAGKELAALKKVNGSNTADHLEDLLKAIHQDLAHRSAIVYESAPEGIEVVSRIDMKVIAKAVADATGAKWDTLLQGADSHLLIEDIERTLLEYVIGQRHAIKRFMNVIKGYFRGTRRQGGVGGMIMFQGPSRIGKTHIAQVAGKKFGEVYEIAGGAFINETKRSELEGAAAGYVGFGETKTFLDWVKENPDGLVIVDEYEKMHKTYKEWFLELQHNPYKKLPNGEEVYLGGIKFVFTSNTLAKDTPPIDISMTDLKKLLNSLDEDHYSPEFLNRFDDIIVLRNFTDNEIEELVSTMWKNQFFPNMHAKSSIEVYLDPRTVKLVAAHSNGGNAATVDFILKENIADRINQMMDSGELLEGQVVEVKPKPQFYKPSYKSVDGEWVISEEMVTPRNFDDIEFIIHDEYDDYVESTMDDIFEFSQEIPEEIVEGAGRNADQSEEGIADLTEAQ